MLSMPRKEAKPQVKLVWQGPTTPREIRKRLGYDGYGDAELLLCGHTGLVIDYGMFGQIRIIFIHEGDKDGNVGNPWAIVHPIFDTYHYEVVMQLLDIVDRTFLILPDDAGFAHATITWRMIATMFGWGHKDMRVRLDSYFHNRGIEL